MAAPASVPILLAAAGLGTVRPEAGDVDHDVHGCEASPRHHTACIHNPVSWTPSLRQRRRPPPHTPTEARAALADALRALQQDAGAGALVNVSRLQLAVRGLQQPAGHETVRVAVLGLAGAVATAAELLRLLLADPLQDAPAWEARLQQHDATQPLIVRVRGPGEHGGGSGASSHASSVGGGLAAIEVSSPALDGHQLEFLVMASPLAAPASAASDPFGEAVLVPMVEIPASQDGLRFTPVTTPVHQALVVGEGLLGAAAMANLPLPKDSTGAGAGAIQAAVNLALPEASSTAATEAPSGTALPFAVVDLAAASRAVDLFRASATNAKAYEALWRRSGVSVLAHWLREGGGSVLTRADGATKPPVRRLVASVLAHTRTRIEAAEAALAGSSSVASSPSPAARSLAALNTALADWAEAAHAELQTQLDAAFAGRRWRKLGWWKLFWRADDVTMLASALVTQQFLPQAEQNMVFLAGRIDEAVRAAGAREATTEGGGPVVLYAAPVVAVEAPPSSPSAAEPSTDSAAIVPQAPQPPTRWPTHIAFTRCYLLDTSVPALQALAQKLLLQTLATSGLATALAALTYASAVLGGAFGGAYEAGAVAALGLVWGLGRMQRTWETARRFWEGEVREEGRKAVRAAEAAAAAALDAARDAAVHGGPAHAAARAQQTAELQRARTLVAAAEDLLKEVD